jgi:NAD-dependent DNA ligase
METRQITDVTGIGPAAAAQLAERGIRTVEDLKNATVEEIRAIPGFGVARAEAVRKAAAQLLGEPAPTAGKEKGKKDKGEMGKGKEKKKKKGKKSDKDKKKKGKGKKGKKGKK